MLFAFVAKSENEVVKKLSIVSSAISDTDPGGGGPGTGAAEDCITVYLVCGECFRGYYLLCYEPGPGSLARAEGYACRDICNPNP